MTADEYLRNILVRETVDSGIYSPVRAVQATLQPIIQGWAGTVLSSVTPSGSFAKGTANKSGTDIDLLISLSSNTTQPLKQIYESLSRWMTAKGYAPKDQNVSINVRVNGHSVDLVPAKRQDIYGNDHSLYRRRADTWTKTNVVTHIGYVQQAGRLNETRILKLWRNQKALDFPSFYLELTVINALAGQHSGSLSTNVWKVFEYLRAAFPNARVVDPANTNNIISDDLTIAERAKIKAAAVQAQGASDWSQIVV
jgi:predicted nucleotidyltransferase